MGISDITKGIDIKLNQLEKKINKILTANNVAMPFMEEPKYLSGGKRVRPILLFLSAQLCGYKGEMDILYAIIMEIIHNATLIHDDIIDDSSVRRGKPSVNSQFGNSLSVLIGDYLYINAIDMALTDENFEIARILSDTTKKMIEGELIQNTRVADMSLTIEDYLDIIKGKTAYLFSACSLIGAILADSSKDERKELYQFGFNLGIAFQLIDDMFNFSSKEEVVGKPVGNDLLEGKITFPIILLLQHTDRKERMKVEAVLKDRTYNTIKIKEIIALLNKYKALQATKDRANFYIEKAKKNLDYFPHCPARENLMLMADFIVKREK